MGPLRVWIIVALSAFHYCPALSLAASAHDSASNIHAYVGEGERFVNKRQLRDEQVIALPSSLCADCNVIDTELLQSLDLKVAVEQPEAMICSTTRKLGLIFNGIELPADTPAETDFMNRSGQTHLDLHKQKPLAVSWSEVCDCVTGPDDDCEELKIDLSIIFSNVGKNVRPGLTYSTRLSRGASMGRTLVFTSEAQTVGAIQSQVQQGLTSISSELSEENSSSLYRALLKSLTHLQASFSAGVIAEPGSDTDVGSPVQVNPVSKILDSSMRSALLITCLVFFTLAPFALLFLRWLLRRHPQIRADLAARSEEKRNRRLYWQAAIRLKLLQVTATFAGFMPWPIRSRPGEDTVLDVEAVHNLRQVANYRRPESVADSLLSHLESEKAIRNGESQSHPNFSTRNSRSGSLGWNSSAASSAPPAYCNSIIIDDASSVIATSSRWYGSEKSGD